MEHIKQKKKPAAKLEQIIIPDKEKSPSVKPDTVCTGIELPAPKVNSSATGVTHNSKPISPLGERRDREFSVSGTQPITQPNTQSITHSNAQPITQQVSNEPVKVEAAPVTKQLKKRGRKRKIPIDAKYTNTDYIVMWPEICMAQKVLVDRYDNVYTYDLNSPLWLGVKTAFGKIDNVTHKAPLTKYYFQ